MGNVVTLAETNDKNIEFLKELFYLVSAPFLTIRFVFVSLKTCYSFLIIKVAT